MFENIKRENIFANPESSVANRATYFKIIPHLEIIHGANMCPGYSMLGIYAHPAVKPGINTCVTYFLQAVNVSKDVYTLRVRDKMFFTKCQTQKRTQKYDFIVCKSSARDNENRVGKNLFYTLVNVVNVLDANKRCCVFADFVLTIRKSLIIKTHFFSSKSGKFPFLPVRDKTRSSLRVAFFRSYNMP